MQYLKNFKHLAMLAVAGFALAAFPAKSANAQVVVGVGGPPVCEYGYYGYAPYACAPYGYYGPSYFNGGIFIGAGPWFHGYYGRGYGYGYGYRGYGLRLSRCLRVPWRLRLSRWLRWIPRRLRLAEAIAAVVVRIAAAAVAASTAVVAAPTAAADIANTQAPAKPRRLPNLAAVFLCLIRT